MFGGGGCVLLCFKKKLFSTGKWGKLPCSLKQLFCSRNLQGSSGSL